MGQGASTAGRSYKAAEAAGKAAAASKPLQQSGGAVAVDAERAAAQQARRAALTLEEEEQHEAKDVAYGTLLDRLGGAIHGTSIDIYPKERVTSLSPSSAGRLPAHALKELFELQRKAEGGPVDASHLISKYNADPALIQQVLSTVCLPDLVQAKGSAGVDAFAAYPAWFTRRR